MIPIKHVTAVFSALIFTALLACPLGRAFADERVEIVTYVPSSSSGNFDRLHANRATIGPPYSLTNPASLANGTLLVNDRLGIGIGTSAMTGRLQVRGPDNAASVVTFMPGTDTSPFGDTSLNVGIGTTTPAMELDIYQDVDAVYLRLWGANDGDNNCAIDMRGELGVLGPTGDRIWQLAHKSGGAGSPGDLHLSYNPDPAGGGAWIRPLVFKTDGRMGIMTTSPSTTSTIGIGGNAPRTIQVERNTVTNTAGNNLAIVAGGATSGATDRNGGVLFLSAGTATGLGGSAIELQTATPGVSGTGDRFPSTKVAILGNGNVGIGLTNPARQLHLDSAAAGPQLRVNNSGTSAAIELFGVSDGSNYSYVDLRSNSNTKIWRASHIATSGDFQLVHNDGVSWSVPFTVTTANQYVGLGGITAPTSRLELPNVAGAGGEGRARVWTDLSSVRFKENITPIAGALEKVLQLRGVSFQWKQDGERGIGLIAEEVDKIFPELVTRERDGRTPAALAYGHLSAVLVEAAKAQQQIIERQQDTIDAQQRQIDQLRRRIEALEKR